MRKTTFIAVITAIITVLPQPLVGWVRTYGGDLHEKGHCIRNASDGGYILCGYTCSFGTTKPGASCVWLLKINPEGDTLWTKVYGYESGYDNARHVEKSSDGGYIIVGKTDYGTLSVKESEVWLLKTDESGDTLWTKTFNFSNYGDYGYWVQETSDGGYILTGETGVLDPTDATTNLFLIKTDSVGNTDWEKVYGGPEGDEGSCVLETSNGGYLVAGHSNTEGGGGIWLLRTDETGDTLWTRGFKLTSSRQIIQTSDQGYVIIGSVHRSDPYESDVFILRIDSLGNQVWLRTYGGDDYDWGYDGEQTADGGYIIVATTESFAHDPHADATDVWLLKTDSLGDTLWTRFYGENWVTAGASMAITPDNGYIMTGLTRDWEGVNTGLRDIWIMKVDSLGNDVPTVSEKPIDTETNWQLLSSIGSEVVMRYADCPQGFRAEVFDASGSKVDEIYADGPSGTITWGDGYKSGVYFIRETKGKGSGQKVVLIR